MASPKGQPEHYHKEHRHLQELFLAFSYVFEPRRTRLREIGYDERRPDSNEAASPRLPHTLDTRNDIGGRDGIGPAEPSAPASDPASDAPALPERPRTTVIVMHASVGSGHRSAANAVAQAFELCATRRRVAADGTPPIPDDLDIEVIDVLDLRPHRVRRKQAASLFTGATRPIYDLTWRFTLTGRLLWGGGSIWSHLMYPAVHRTRARQCVPGHRVHAHHRRERGRGGADADLASTTPSCACLPTTRPKGSGPISRRPVLRRERVDGRNAAPAQGARGQHPHHRHPHARRVPRVLRQTPLRARAVGAAPGQAHRAGAGGRVPAPPLRAFPNRAGQVCCPTCTASRTHARRVRGRKRRDYARHLRHGCDDLGLSNVTVLDYVDDMAALMAASDLVICKSGGLTVTECLCAQVPMILLGKAYGQEKANVSHAHLDGGRHARDHVRASCWTRCATWRATPKAPTPC